MNMNDLLSLNDALEDFDACEYTLVAPVQVRIGAQTSEWRLVLSPPMFPGADGKRACLVTLSRTATVGARDADLAGAGNASDATSATVRLTEIRAPDLLGIAAAYGIDPAAHIWELVWSVPFRASHIPRAHDQRWPHEPATPDEQPLGF